MNLKDIVAVSSLAGLYKMVSSRSNGLIIADLDTGKTRFAATRKHQFTPLESVAIFTDMDSVSLSDIFQTMRDKSATLAVVSAKDPNSEILSYFKEVLPDYDKDRVHVSDMKKVIKWYKFLDERGLLAAKSGDEEE